MLQDLDRVMSNQSQVVEFELASADQAMADTGFMYFDSQEVRLRVLAGLLNECVAVAKAEIPIAGTWLLLVFGGLLIIIRRRRWTATA